MNFHFFDSRPFQMSSSEIKLYFITYYRPFVYLEVFSIYLSVFHECMWSSKKAKKKLFLDFLNFFFSLFSRGGGGNYSDNSGRWAFFLWMTLIIFNCGLLKYTQLPPLPTGWLRHFFNWTGAEVKGTCVQIISCYHWRNHLRRWPLCPTSGTTGKIEHAL